MFGAQELLNVALFSIVRDHLLFDNWSTSTIIKGFGSDLLLGAGGFIEIVGSCSILLVNAPLQDIHCGAFWYKIVGLTQSNLLKWNSLNPLPLHLPKFSGLVLSVAAN
jgi:hypothetical protein